MSTPMGIVRDVGHPASTRRCQRDGRGSEAALAPALDAEQEARDALRPLARETVQAIQQPPDGVVSTPGAGGAKNTKPTEPDRADADRTWLSHGNCRRRRGRSA